MHPGDSPMEMLSVASIMLVLLLNCHRTFILDYCCDGADEEIEDPFPPGDIDKPLLDVQGVSQVALQQWTIWSSLNVLDEDLGFWVKPRSTAWFSKFLLEEYDDTRWINIFRLTKAAFMSLSTLLAPAIRRRDTSFRDAVPVIIRLGCCLFKLCQGASLLICSELFAVGRSTVSAILRDVVSAMNEALRREIQWPTGEQIDSVAADFYQLCGLPAVVGAIDVTHFTIAKPQIGAADYFHFKSGAFTMTCQAVVDSRKHFLDVNVGMPGSTNDARILRRSALYHRGHHGVLFQGHAPIQGFYPFLIGDGGYPTLPWLMAPHRHMSTLSMSQRLFNRKLSKGRAVVENAFAMLKQNFRELSKKSDLHVSFLPDVVVVCALLHNVLLQASHEDVERIIRDLATAGPRQSDTAVNTAPLDVLPRNQPRRDPNSGRQIREDLGIFLSLQRSAPY